MSESGLPRRPLLAPWYRVIGQDERVLLEHAGSLVVLEGAAVRALLPTLLPLLDGTRTLDDLAARLGVAARPAIVHALAVLAGHDLLVEGPDAAGARRAAAHAAAAAFALTPAEAVERLDTFAVGIVGASPAAAEIGRLLHRAGIEHVRRASWRGDPTVELTVVAPAVDELDRVPAWNRRAARRSTPWLLVRPFDGRVATVGPLVVPGESACHECVLRRRGANLGYGADVFDVEAAPAAAVASVAVTAFLEALAADLVLRFGVGGDPTLPGVLTVVETQPELAVTRHLVLRVPRCEVCSGVDDRPGLMPWHEALAA